MYQGAFATTNDNVKDSVASHRNSINSSIKMKQSAMSKAGAQILGSGGDKRKQVSNQHNKQFEHKQLFQGAHAPGSFSSSNQGAYGHDASLPHQVQSLIANNNLDLVKTKMPG